MEPLKKREMLRVVKNEYLAAILAAKVARRLHAMTPSDRSDPDAKVTSLAIKMVTDGDVEYDVPEDQRAPAQTDGEGEKGKSKGKGKGKSKEKGAA
ncbi:hypothetical protein K8S17_01080 [bacterium]|nr:hypothetical protein [bacterium]